LGFAPQNTLTQTQKKRDFPVKLPVKLQKQGKPTFASYRSEQISQSTHSLDQGKNLTRKRNL